MRAAGRCSITDLLQTVKIYEISPSLHHFFSCIFLRHAHAHFLVGDIKCILTRLGHGFVVLKCVAKSGQPLSTRDSNVIRKLQRSGMCTSPTL
jgi:hypothetical protein